MWMNPLIFRACAGSDFKAFLFFEVSSDVE